MAANLGSELVIAAGLLSVLAASLEAGFRLGRRAVRNREAPSGGMVGAVQGAALGLLGLLLGFSFSGAAGRFLERQDLIVQETNAIGTAFLRADLLDEPHRSGLRAALAHYVSHRVEVSERLRHGMTRDDASRVAELHAALWAHASNGVAAKPALSVAVLNPVNEVIDVHSLRVSAGRKHLPAMVLGLLILSSAVGVAVIGYGCGLSGKRWLPMTGALALLIWIALWTTIDLDHPRAGLIRLNDSALRELNLAPEG